MKKILLIICTIIITGCNSNKNTNVNMIDVNNLTKTNLKDYPKQQQTITNKCLTLNNPSNTNILDSKYYYQLEKNNITIYKKIQNNCPKQTTIKLKDKVKQVKEINDKLYIATNHYMYIVDNNKYQQFGKYNEVSDFNIVDDTLIFASNYDKQKRLNTLVFIKDNKAHTYQMGTNESKLETINIKGNYVVISFISDFLGRNYLSYYSLSQKYVLENIRINSAESTLSKNYNPSLEKTNQISDINRLAYDIDKQLQCDEKTTTCLYIDQAVLTYNDKYTIIKKDNKFYLVNKEKNTITLIDDNTNHKYELSDNKLIIRKNNIITTYELS